MMLKQRSSSGFTLIEMAIVVIVSGLLTLAGVKAYELYQKDAQVRETNETLARVDKALNDYRAKTGRFPCPADPGQTGDLRGKEWGRERETEDGDNGGHGTGFPDIFKEGYLSPVSIAYCKKVNNDTDDEDDNGIPDGYQKCIELGSASICKTATAESRNGINTVADVWPTPAWGNAKGASGCGNGAGTETIPSKHACISTGDRPDNLVDFNNDGKIDENDSDTGAVPEDLSCIQVGANCPLTTVRWVDKQVGGDGLNFGETGDTDGLNVGEKAKLTQVLIGAVPFHDLEISETDARDGYGNPLRYAVTVGLTSRDTFDAEQTGIVVGSQKPGDTPDPDNVPQIGVQYVLVSFGKTGADSNFYGQITNSSPPVQTLPGTGRKAAVGLCRGETVGNMSRGGFWADGTAAPNRFIDSENCDTDADFLTEIGKSMDWDGSGNVRNYYFDDTVMSNVSSLSGGLWASDGPNIYSTNAGNIGVDQPAPVSKLTIGNVVYDDVDANMNIQGDLIVSGRICDSSGKTDSDGDGSVDCSTDGIDTNVLVTGGACPDGQGIKKIVNGVVTCEDIPGWTNGVCDDGYYLAGYKPGPPKQFFCRRGNDTKTCNENWGGCS